MTFFRTTVDEVGIHHGEKYIPYIGTLFIFILSMNLIGIMPAFESPTMSPWVPAGLAVVTFIYFNAMGFRRTGIKYLMHFAGPVPFPHPVANVAIILFMTIIELSQRVHSSSFAHCPSLRQHVCGRAGDQRFPKPHQNCDSGDFHGSARICFFIQAYVFFLLTTIYMQSRHCA